MLLTEMVCVKKEKEKEGEVVWIPNWKVTDLALLEDLATAGPILVS